MRSDSWSSPSSCRQATRPRRAQAGTRPDGAPQRDRLHRRRPAARIRQRARHAGALEDQNRRRPFQEQPLAVPDVHDRERVRDRHRPSPRRHRRLQQHHLGGLPDLRYRQFQPRAGHAGAVRRERSNPLRPRRSLSGQLPRRRHAARARAGERLQHGRRRQARTDRHPGRRSDRAQERRHAAALDHRDRRRDGDAWRRAAPARPPAAARRRRASRRRRRRAATATRQGRRTTTATPAA